METSLQSDRPPLTLAERVPVGTGRLTALVGSDGCRLDLDIRHCRMHGAGIRLQLELDADACDQWRGDLNAEMAVFTEKFQADGTDFVREVIAHMGAGLLLVRLAASRPFSCGIGFSGAASALASTKVPGASARITLAGRDSDGTPWAGELRLHLGGGEVAADGGRLLARGAYELVFEISLGYGADGAATAECGRHRIGAVDGWDPLIQQHIDAWRQHFGGLTGTISGADSKALLPARFAAMAAGKPDGRLIFALLQCCRYLLAVHYGTATVPPGGGDAVDDQGDWAGLPQLAMGGYLQPLREPAQRILDSAEPSLAAAAIVEALAVDFMPAAKDVGPGSARLARAAGALAAMAGETDGATVVARLLGRDLALPQHRLRLAPCVLAVADALPAAWRRAVAGAAIDAATPGRLLAAHAWQAALSRDGETAAAHVKSFMLEHTQGYLTPVHDCEPDLPAAGLIAAAIVAMVCQSDKGSITLVPALPPEWAQGAMHGLRARGGWTLSLEWSLYRVSKVVIAGNPGGKCELRNLPDAYTLADDHDKSVPFEQHGDSIHFIARPMSGYILQRTGLR